MEQPSGDDKNLEGGEVREADSGGSEQNSSSSTQPSSPNLGLPLADYGTRRGLKSHHIQLVAISGVIGTGLFVGTANPLSHAGPAGLLIAYTIWSGLLICVAHAMGEMSAYLPVPGSFPMHISRFIDESAGVAMGWLYAYWIFTAADATALTALWAYFFPGPNPGVWVALTLTVIFILNCLAVKYFGEIEFYASLLKVILIVGFILFAFIADLGGNPLHDRIGFRYWENPGAFNTQYTTGALGRFLALWNTFNFAAFTVGGPDFIANCAPEAINPRRNIPKAAKRVIYRLILFFIISVFAVGLLVPYNDPQMVKAIIQNNGTAKSPYLIAMNRLHVKFLPNLCNALIISSAWSCTNCLLFQASRTIYGLAKYGRAPKIFLFTTKHGVPIPALVLSIAVASLAFLTCNTGSAVVLTWFINLGSTAIMIAYILMMWANARFHRGLKAQGIDPKTLPWKSSITPYSNYFAGFWVIMILLTNGFGVFIHGNWKFADFFTAYFALVFYSVVYVGWKVIKRTAFVKPEDMDFKTGLAEVEAHEATLDRRPPFSRYDRFMDWLW